MNSTPENWKPQLNNGQTALLNESAFIFGKRSECDLSCLCQDAEGKKERGCIPEYSSYAWKDKAVQNRTAGLFVKFLGGDGEACREKVNSLLGYTIMKFWQHILQVKDSLPFTEIL